MNSNEIFENTLINTNVYQLVLDYLSLKDINNVIFFSKNVLYKRYVCKLIKNRASISIFNLMLKNRNILKNITQRNFDILYMNNKLTKKTLALYYFKFYEKRFINAIYNEQHGNKKLIIDTYKDKDKITENPTRYDLYLLLKKIPIHDILYIGW
jgi:hypothetical protein